MMVMLALTGFLGNRINSSFIQLFYSHPPSLSVRMYVCLTVHVSVRVSVCVS